jgi:hypothetical protein
MYRKTPVAAQELGITYWQLIGLLRSGRLTPPGRDTSGDYVWTDADLTRARKAMAAQAGHTKGVTCRG